MRLPAAARTYRPTPPVPLPSLQELERDLDILKKNVIVSP